MTSVPRSARYTKSWVRGRMTQNTSGTCQSHYPSPSSSCLLTLDAPGSSNRVEMGRNFASEGKHRGNECNRWHGTTRKCKIGDKGTTWFCSDTSCSLCCIMKASFDLKFFGKKTNFGRFGVGIYTSATSSKSAHVFSVC